MKYSLIIMLSLLSFFSKGQNYKCFPGGKQFFTASNGYLRGIRIDSVQSYTDSTIYYPYHTYRGPYDPAAWGTVKFTDSAGGSWVGKKIISYPDGMYLFDNLLGDTVIIKTRANTGDTWTFYNDTGDLHFDATVVNADTATIAGFADSVKTILVRAYNSSGAAVTTEPMDSSVIVLTQNHGFARLFELYTFPYHKPDSAYKRGLDFILDDFLRGAHPDKNNCSFQRIDFINPTTKELHNWSVGDFWGTLSVYGYYITGTWSYGFYETVTDKQDISGASVYTVTGTRDTCLATSHSIGYSCKALYPAGIYTFSDSEFPILDTAQLPEETICKKIIFYTPQDTGFCMQSPSYKVQPTQYFIGGLGGYLLNKDYKLGFGMTNYTYADGEPTNESDYLQFGIFHSVNCNVPPHLSSTTSIRQQTKVYPNPATANITIESEIELNTITIADMLGRIMLTKNATSKKAHVDIVTLSPGVYILKINDSIVTMLQKQE